ncbi:response regulator [Aerosakkonema funiforme]|uniref:response regulator n=1 Tax=Aerosakkonema funiforme TaxID=1246630 RepID=UPI0035B9C4FF
MRILLVEDDEAIVAVVTDFLANQYYILDVAHDGEAGWDLVEAFTYDLVLLDVMLPKLDGITLCRRIRSHGYQMPVVLLTTHQTSTDKVMGPDVEADDYVVKPFDLKELDARIRTLLHRGNSATPVLKWAKLRLDPSTCEVSNDDRQLHLSPKETQDKQTQIVAAGLPDELTSWLLERLGVVSIQSIHSSEETLLCLEQSNWSLLILDRSLITADVAAVLDQSYLKFKQGKQSVLYCLEKNLSSNLPNKIIGQILFYPLDWENLAAVIADTLQLSLPSPSLTPNPTANSSSLNPTYVNTSLAPEPQSKPARETEISPQTSQIAHLQTTVGKIWEKYKDKFISRVALLERTSKALLAGTLNDEMRQQAVRESHKLAGSLGMYGFEEASHLAQQIEQLLQPQVHLGQAEAQHLSQFVVLLQQQLQQTPTTEASDELKVESQPQILTKNSPRLLIVEDDTEQAQLLVLEAASWGMQADWACNLSAARVSLTSKPPDLVLLDLSFPDTDETGLTLLKQLSQQNPQLPVVVLTRCDTFIDRIEVARLGGCGFLQKPIAPSKVMEIVSQMLHREDTANLKVMVVDDDREMLLSLETLLQPWRLRLTTLNNPLQLWDTLEATAPDLVILDVDMPDASGIELCKVIRNDPKWNSLPVLFISASTDPSTVQRAFDAGGDDYINKPIKGPELVKRIFNRLERIRLLRSFAETDLLTGLANRHSSTQDLERFLYMAKRYCSPFCFGFLDLDYFKHINDRYGHATGDRVLRRLGKLLLQSFRSADVVARWGGEEFAIGMYGVTKQVGAKRLYEILQTLRQQEFVELDGSKFHITFSAGVVQYPDDGTDLQTLYQVADRVLYQAKTSGRNRVFCA